MVSHRGPMATWFQVPSDMQVQTVLVQLRVEYSRVRRCLVIWVAVKVTIQNLEVVRVDAEKNLLLVKGAVPGPKKALVTIKGNR